MGLSVGEQHERIGGEGARSILADHEADELEPVHCHENAGVLVLDPAVAPRHRLHRIRMMIGLEGLLE